MRGWWFIGAIACSDPEGPLDAADPPASTEMIARRAAIDLSDPYVCEDPSARSAQRFDQTSPRPQPDSHDYDLTRAGVIVADIDGNGTLDTLLPHEGKTELWMRTADGLTDEAPTRLAGIDMTAAIGGTAVDVEGDGDLDLYITRWQVPNLLLRNDGTGHFTDVTVVAGLWKYAWRTQSASWADFDLDGDLDLFSGSYGPALTDAQSHGDEDLPPTEDESQLWRNNGDGTFTDETALLPREVQDGWTFMSTWVDTSGDGYPELFVWHDFGASYPSVVLGNDGGTGFLLELGTTQVDQAWEDMGVAMGDVNNDQMPDFVTTSYTTVRMLASKPTVSTYAGPAWIESAASRGIAVDVATWDQYYGWGAEFGDLDNDRDEDLMMLFGRWSSYDNTPAAYTQRDGLWLQGEDGKFENFAATPEWNLDDQGVKRGLVFADLNDDGYLDLVKRQQNGPALRYESRCDDRAWLRIALQQPDQNPSAVGARITATSPDGLVQTRWMTLGSTSMYSSAPTVVHFGLGDDETVDLEILWPDQGVSTISNVPTRRVATITRQ